MALRDTDHRARTRTGHGTRRRDSRPHSTNGTVLARLAQRGSLRRARTMARILSRSLSMVFSWLLTPIPHIASRSTLAKRRCQHDSSHSVMKSAATTILRSTV